jgi:hypothetical protein
MALNSPSYRRGFPMNTRPRWNQRLFLAVLVLGLPALTEADARASGRGRSGQHGARAPRVSAARQSYKAPRTPRSPSPAHSNAMRGQSWANNGQAGNRNRQFRANGAQAQLSNSSTRANQVGAATTNRTTAGALSPSTTTPVNAIGSLASTNYPSNYTYGYGSGARNLRAYGYGSGYRNRYYGGGYGYGRSQGNNRAIVARLRSVRMSLARIDHDYQGHRVRAMHAISMAIRQLSHRSMVYSGTGFSSGMNSGAGMGMGRGMRQNGLGAGGRRGQVMPQAQSDARMSQSRRNLQGIGMQLSNQGSSTMGHGRALGHIQRAIHELNVALSIR